MFSRDLRPDTNSRPVVRPCTKAAGASQVRDNRSVCILRRTTVIRPRRLLTLEPLGGYGPQSGGPPPPPTAPVSFGNGAPQGYSFQYSRCTGKRKALLIGINYFGQKGQLRGCINDVKNMSAYLNQNFGYAREDMVLLTDDQQNPMSQPTKANILRAMHWLVKDAQPNDSLFFHYSGEWPCCKTNQSMDQELIE